MEEIYTTGFGAQSSDIIQNLNGYKVNYVFTKHILLWFLSYNIL